MHKVIRPHFIGSCRGIDRCSGALCLASFAWPTVWQRQACQSPHSLHALMVDLLPGALQYSVRSPIAEAKMLDCDLL